MRIAHFSDTHLGFSQYPVMNESGRNIRGQDILAGFKATIEDIVAYDPDLVIHAGDFFDHPHVDIRMQLAAQAGLRRLSQRLDGSTRPVVVITGNHDQPRNPKDPAALELFKDMPGVYVCARGYMQFEIKELSDVVVHAIPHDSLKILNEYTVDPVKNKINILTTHGVVGGSSQYMRVKGREYALPLDILARGWDYVALGHWHKWGPVAVGGYSENTTPAWYSGSTENNGFGDVGSEKGWLEVELDEGKRHVTRRPIPVRAMFDLKEVDAKNMTVEQIEESILNNLKDSAVAGAVVRQKVSNCSRDKWVLLNSNAIRKAAQSCLWFELRPFLKNEEELGSELLQEESAEMSIMDFIKNYGRTNEVEEVIVSKAVDVFKEVTGG